MSKLKTACLWLMVPFALPAADFDPGKILTGIEDRYNHIQTLYLQVDFVQTYGFRGPHACSEKGHALPAHKPRRMRWEYSLMRRESCSSPTGSFITITTRKNQEASRKRK